MAFLRYLAARFSEPSTYAGMGAFLMSLGIVLPEGVLQAIVTAGCGVSALLAMMLPDKA